MDMVNNARHRQRASTWLALGALTLVAPFASAQNFEAYYGEQTARDAGQDIKIARTCPNQGSVTVGTRVVGNLSHALVTRVDDNGVPLWQYAYRVAAANTQAYAVVELRDGTGFALTGAVTQTDTLIYVLKIDCNGNVLWTTVLGNLATAHRAIGYDITQAAGNGTPPELIVIGDESVGSPTPTTHGRIARLKSNGSPLWDYAYNQPTTAALGLRFRGVTLATAATGALTDIVVAGSFARATTWADDRRALMFRVDANGTPICNAFLGAPDTISEDFQGVTVLGAAPYTGDTVLVGASQLSGTKTTQAAYLTRFRAGGCVPMAQAFWRDPNGGPTAFDAADANGIAALPVSVAVNGTIRQPPLVADGFLAVADPLNLAPMLPPLRFATQGAKLESLVALDRKGNRFVMAGDTQTDWDGTGDPQDFYVVQTDPLLATQCAVGWNMVHQPMQLPYQSFAPPRLPITTALAVPTARVTTTGNGYCCVLDPN